MQSEQINDLAEALSKAQGQMKPVVNDASNPFFKSKYATLAAHWEAARKPLTDNNLSVMQISEIVESGVILVTRLTHSSGQWISSEYPVNPTKQDPQGLGSAITYARRYSFSALVGTCALDADDDDGNAASQPQAKKQPAKNGNGQKTEREKIIGGLHLYAKKLEELGGQGIVFEEDWLKTSTDAELKKEGVRIKGLVKDKEAEKTEPVAA